MQVFKNFNGPAHCIQTTQKCQYSNSILSIKKCNILAQFKPSELGVSRSMECDTFPLQCFDTVDWARGRASDLM